MTLIVLIEGAVIAVAIGLGYYLGYVDAVGHQARERLLERLEGR